MKCVILINVVVFIGATLVLVDALKGGRSDGVHWRAYKSKYNKVYGDPTEESMRMRIFLENKQRIERHNSELAPKLGYQMGHSQLSDWTKEELQQLNAVIPNNVRKSSGLDSTAETPQFLREILEMDDNELPKEVDWRKVSGRVGPVKDQGKCSAGWAFATTGLLEGQQYRFNLSQVVPLSEQNLIDCSDGNMKCQGGLASRALMDIKRGHGIESEQDYPYGDGQGQVERNCTFDKSKSVMNVRAAHMVPLYEGSLQRAVARFGPIATSFHAPDSLYNYKSGVFTDRDCDRWLPEPNHSVLLVGYGSDPKEGDYWIVKNSWGADWGENGYFRLPRFHVHYCSIGMDAVVPVV